MKKNAPPPPPVVFSTKKVTRRKSAAPVATPKPPTTTESDAPSTPSSSGALRRHSSSGSGGNSASGSGRPHAARRHASPHSQKRKKSGGGALQQLQPASALLQSEQNSVAQCVRSMVEKKTDATLLLDTNGLLTGILTDRVRAIALRYGDTLSFCLLRGYLQDIAFKVVAMDKNPKLTRVRDVMTPNPSCVASSASAIDALKKMVSGQFRHLPVTDNEKGTLSFCEAQCRNVTDAIRWFSLSSGGDLGHCQVPLRRDLEDRARLRAVARSPVGGREEGALADTLRWR